MAVKYVHHYTWTPEMDNTVKELYGTSAAKKIAEIVNEEFGTGFSHTAIWNRAQKLQLTDGSNRHSYTEEQDEWLRQSITKYSYKDLVGAFNKEFQTNIAVYALKTHCINKLHLKGGTFDSKGYRPSRRAPIGTEYIDPSGNAFIKVSDEPKKRGGSRAQHTNWRPKGRCVWEQHYGEIPEGHNIVHLDGDPSNCDISNLECTTKSIQGGVSHLRGTSPEVMRCAIKMKTLEKILEGIGEQ